MYCPACGTALTRQTKYCRQCGAPLTAADEAADKHWNKFESWLEDLFWVTVFGLAIIVGGAAILNKLLHPGRGVIIGYLFLSSLAFLIIFGLDLWRILQLMKMMKGKALEFSGEPPNVEDDKDTNKFAVTQEPKALEPGSVIEEVTRTFEEAKAPVRR